MSIQYDVLIGGKVYGPFDVQKVRQLIAQRILHKNSEVRIGEEKWSRLGKIDLFFGKDGNPVLFEPTLPPLPENTSATPLPDQVSDEENQREALEGISNEYSPRGNNGKNGKSSFSQLRFYALIAKFVGWIPFVLGVFLFLKSLVNIGDVVLKPLDLFFSFLFAFTSLSIAFMFFALSSCLNGFASIVEHFETSENNRQERRG